jgi:hypothetical protein
MDDDGPGWGKRLRDAIECFGRLTLMLGATNPTITLMQRPETPANVAREHPFPAGDVGGSGRGSRRGRPNGGVRPLVAHCSFDTSGGVQGVKVQPGLGFQASCELNHFHTWNIFLWWR